MMTRVADVEKRELWVTWTGGSVRGENGTITVGRDASCEVTIENDSGVSRRHARFKLLPTAIKLEDLGSRNGTFVVGRRLTGRALLRGGEAIRIGNTELRAYASEAELTRSVEQAYTDRPAPRGEVTDTTMSTNVFSQLVKDVALAKLTSPAEARLLLAQACDTAQQLATAGALHPGDAAAVTECALREGAQSGDANWLRRVFLFHSAGRIPMSLELAGRLLQARAHLGDFPEEELGGYISVLAGTQPPDEDAKRDLSRLLELLMGGPAT